MEEAIFGIAQRMRFVYDPRQLTQQQPCKAAYLHHFIQTFFVVFQKFFVSQLLFIKILTLQSHTRKSHCEALNVIKS